MAQDFYDILQPFDYIHDKLDDNKATLGLRYIAENDDTLLNEYPAVLIQTDRQTREYHATQMFLVTFFLDLWVFHAEMTVDYATRSRRDIELATAIRKLIHEDMTLGGHIVDGWVDTENPGIAARILEQDMVGVVTTRLTWIGRNRVRFEDS